MGRMIKRIHDRAAAGGYMEARRKGPRSSTWSGWGRRPEMQNEVDHELRQRDAREAAVKTRRPSFRARVGHFLNRAIGRGR